MGGRLGVSVGSIYRYVESKEALFHLAALESLDRLPVALPLPFKVAGSAETVAVLTKNRPGDRTAGAISDAQARAAAVRIFANAFD